MFFLKNYAENEAERLSGVTLLFEHSPSQASEIEHFEILVAPRKIFTQQFFCKFNLLLFFLNS